MSLAEPESTIECELCGLPHRDDAVECDRCEHRLGTQPNWDALRDELPELKSKMLVGAVALMGMIALNVMVFGGAGYVILVAPIGWIMFSGYRYRVLSEQIRRRPRR